MSRAYRRTVVTLAHGDIVIVIAQIPLAPVLSPKNGVPFRDRMGIVVRSTASASSNVVRSIFRRLPARPKIDTNIELSDCEGSEACVAILPWPTTALLTKDLTRRMGITRLKRQIRARILRWGLPQVAQRVLRQQLTYLSTEKMASLVSELKRIEREKVPGDLAEFGVALGGSAIVMASHRQGRLFDGYDVFTQIPPPTASDGADAHDRFKVIANGQATGLGGRAYYGYVDDLYDRVRQSFHKFDLIVDQKTIALHKGLFENTFRVSSRKRFSLVHIDCDWYDPVYFCISNVSPLLSVGGAIIIDDYNDFSGCKSAVNYVMERDKSLVIERTLPHAVIRKISIVTNNE